MELSTLLQAAIDGNTELIKNSLKEGADINEVSKSGSSALIYAAQNNNIEAVKFLIENGADANIKNKMGGTALNRAAENGNIEMMQYLIDHDVEIGPLSVDYCGSGRTNGGRQVVDE